MFLSVGSMAWSVLTSSCRKSWLLWYVFLVVFLLLCGCQCCVFLPGGFMGWSVHTSPCGKSWLLCCNCVLNCFFAVSWLSVLRVSLSLFLWVGLCTHLPVERAGCFGLIVF